MSDIRSLKGPKITDVAIIAEAIMGPPAEIAFQILIENTSKSTRRIPATSSTAKFKKEGRELGFPIVIDPLFTVPT